MSDYAIVIETGYKRTSANYHIELVGPLGQVDAEEQFGRLRTGRDERLPAEDDAVVVDASPTQFLRLRRVRGATVMDRVTLGPTVEVAG
ncbi:MAG: hypothetical protein M3Y71_19740 [Actinomycetota bacterium]|nr:hypothetical protein [Actinomycetota bacterium]